MHLRAGGLPAQWLKPRGRRSRVKGENALSPLHDQLKQNKKGRVRTRNFMSQASRSNYRIEACFKPSQKNKRWAKKGKKGMLVSLLNLWCEAVLKGLSRGECLKNKISQLNSFTMSLFGFFIFILNASFGSVFTSWHSVTKSISSINFKHFPLEVRVFTMMPAPDAHVTAWRFTSLLMPSSQIRNPFTYFKLKCCLFCSDFF